jgi:hypothetical protein
MAAFGSGQSQPACGQHIGTRHFNTEFEAEWKSHLEMLSDEEVYAVDPKVALCGLFDRVERVTRVFDEEIARRRSTSKAPWFS